MHYKALHLENYLYIFHDLLLLGQFRRNLRGGLFRQDALRYLHLLLLAQRPNGVGDGGVDPTNRLQISQSIITISASAASTRRRQPGCSSLIPKSQAGRSGEILPTPSVGFVTSTVESVPTPHSQI
jgi:hypothetical protein